MKFLRKTAKLIVTLMVFAVLALMILPVQLNVTGRSQYPTLPNGCEAVAASVAMTALGAPIEAETFASQYLPKTTIGSGVGPEDAYIGDPFGEGYYCYPGALVTGMNNFLSAQPTTLRAQTHAITPVSELALRLHLQKKPLVVWMTVDDKTATRDETTTWQVDGREMHPYTNLHVVVVDGISGFRVHLVDSVNGARWVSLLKFIPSYYSMGLRAISFTD